MIGLSYRAVGTAWFTALLTVLPLAVSAEESGSGAANLGPQLTVTYLGNEGVMISAPSGRVLVDALFGDGLTGYENVPHHERDRLERAAVPFDAVDLVLATHHHGDHFDAAAVLRHLNSNPAALFVSTEQALGALEDEAKLSLNLAQRVRAVQPEPGARIDVGLSFARLEALHITHGSRQPPVQNLGFLLEIDGLKLLHLGDSEATLDDLLAYGLLEKQLDIVFAPYWYLLDETGRTALSRGIGARTVIPVHVPASDAPASYFGRPGGRDELLRFIEAAMPGVALFEEALDTLRFSVPRSEPGN